MNVKKRRGEQEENKAYVSSDSQYGSGGSGLSNDAAGVVFVGDKRRVSESEEKKFEVSKLKNKQFNTIITSDTDMMKGGIKVKIEDYGDSKGILPQAILEPPQQLNLPKPVQNINSQLSPNSLQPNIPNLKPPQKLQESLITASSPSRGSVLTNPQQPGGRFGSSLNNSNTHDTYPLKPGKAINMFKNVLSDYEKGEILNYREIYYLGENAATKKVSR